MLSKIKKIFPVAVYLFPLVMFAQSVRTDEGTLGGIGVQIIGLLSLVVPIVMTFALIYFFIGLMKYIMAAGDEESKGAGRMIMVNGVIALFVMASVWGLVGVLGRSFRVDGGVTPDSQPLIPR